MQPVSRRTHLLSERRKGYERLEPSDLGSRSADPASTWDGAEGSEADGEQDRSSRVPRLHPARFLNERGAGAPVHEPDEPELASLIAIDVVDVLVAVVVVLVAYLGLSAFRFVLRPRVFRWPNRGRSTCRRLRSCCSCCTSLRVDHHGENHRQAGDGRGRCGPTVPGSGLDGPSCRDPVLVLPLRAAVVSRSIASTERCTTCWSGPLSQYEWRRRFSSPDGNLVAPRSSP